MRSAARSSEKVAGDSGRAVLFVPLLLPLWQFTLAYSRTAAIPLRDERINGTIVRVGLCRDTLLLNTLCLCRCGICAGLRRSFCFHFQRIRCSTEETERVASLVVFVHDDGIAGCRAARCTAALGSCLCLLLAIEARERGSVGGFIFLHR
ncbi:hypothetical protein [Agrobacterium larrymoorei]|uniref:hypothetical protein n=1 Tax=Agrobacterium larrymoorei TaxID=160699 RepID=UPI0030C2279E